MFGWSPFLLPPTISTQPWNYSYKYITMVVVNSYHYQVFTIFGLYVEFCSNIMGIMQLDGLTHLLWHHEGLDNILLVLECYRVYKRKASLLLWILPCKSEMPFHIIEFMCLFICSYFYAQERWQNVAFSFVRVCVCVFFLGGGGGMLLPCNKLRVKIR